MSTSQTPEQKPASQPAEEDTGEDWIFDSIIGFLRSPRWKTPVMSFIDEYCIYFDNEDEHKLEFTTHHNNFKKIVEDLLEELLAELGIEGQTFVDACEKAKLNPIHNKIVDQITSVENFLLFKKLMVKRNQDLTRQCEEMNNKAKTGGAEAESKPTATGTTPATTDAPVAAANAAAAASDAPAMGEEAKKKQEAELKEVMRVAHSLERAEEEEMMKRAMEESNKHKTEEQKAIEEEEEMMRQAIEASQREEEERQAKLKSQSELDGAVQNASAVEAEMMMQKKALEQKERELKAMIDEQKRAKAEADEAFKLKEQALADRERQLNEQSQLSQQELEAERKRIAEEREKALADAKAQGSAAAKKVVQTPATVASMPQAEPTDSVNWTAPVTQAAQAPTPMAPVKSQPVAAAEVAPKSQPKSVMSAAGASQVRAQAPEAATFSMPSSKAMDPLPEVSSNPGALPALGGLPSIGGGRSKFGGLGGVHGRAGAFDIDEKYLKQAQAELAKLNRINDPNIGDEEEEKKEGDTRTFAQVMADKRKATEADLAAKQAALQAAAPQGGETMEDRKARLLAQRDILRRQKEEKRQKELEQFNDKLGENSSAKPNLAEEFKQMDANKQLPVGANPEVDRRRMIYKNIRKEIAQTDQAAKDQAITKKMTQMEQKVKERDQQRSQQEMDRREREARAEADKQKQRAAGKNFLDNLEAFNVDQ